MATLYTPYKAIGYVCDGNPFEINRLGEEIFLTVTIGNCFQVFRFNKLTNCLVSKTVGGNINCLKVSGDETYAAVDQSIIVYKRSEIVHKYAAHNKRITGLVLIGNVLVSYDDSNVIKLLDVKARGFVAEMKVVQQSTISSMIHPASYINKVLIGYRNGQLELWNINKKVLIYTFGSHLQYFKTKNRTSGSDAIAAVTALEQSPACDVIAVGFSTGDILLLNLKLDQVLFGYLQTGGAVTSLSFRTDAKAKTYPFLVSSSASGVLHVWNLGTHQSTQDQATSGSGVTRSLHSSLEEAHKGRVSRVAFLPGEPIMVSSGEDNTLKVWIFDAPDGSARLHSSREGHSGFPTRIRYYGGTSQVSMRDSNTDASSCELISAGSDGTLRLFNTAISNQNRELSQKPIVKALGLLRRNESLPNCIGFDFSESKERHWSNLVSVHEKHSTAFLWKYKQRVISEVMLKAPSSSSSSSSSHCSSAVFSMCGNFCLVGYLSGAIYKFNVQSGQCRGSYPKSAHNALKAGTVIQRAKLPANVLYAQAPTATVSSAPSAASNELLQQQQHQQEVTGLFVDMTNATLVSCGLDGVISFWDFNNQTLLHQVNVGSPLLMMVGFRDSNFVAVADQNRTVHVFDVHSFRLIRKYAQGHSQQITDIAFSPDGRRLLTSSLDCTVRVWELSTSRCLSWLRFNRPVMSIAVSLNGEYLCVTQSDRNGIFMYADRSLFETVHFWKEPTAPVLVEDSTLIDEDNEGEVTSSAGDDAVAAAAVEPVDEAAVETAAQDEALIAKNRASEDVVSFSTCPRVFWSSLFHLEAIKLRNKLATPTSATPAAPFFLPTVVRGEANVAFPTVEEYSRMTASGSAKRPLAEEAGAVASSKLMKTNSAAAVETGDAVDEEAFDENDWSGMASAWNDDDAAAVPSSAVVVPETHEPASGTKNQSRLLKNANIPRCKLMALLQKKPSSDSAVLAYLKTLSAPAVDVEINALCTNDIELQQHLDSGSTEAPALFLWLQWLGRSVANGHEFELLQAYLHRTLAVYSELVLKSPVALASGSTIVSDIAQLQTANDAMTNSFRTSIQRNLCMLKILANIPLS